MCIQYTNARGKNKYIFMLPHTTSMPILKSACYVWKQSSLEIKSTCLHFNISLLGIKLTDFDSYNLYETFGFGTEPAWCHLLYNVGIYIDMCVTVRKQHTCLFSWRTDNILEHMALQYITLLCHKACVWRIDIEREYHGMSGGHHIPQSQDKYCQCVIELQPPPFNNLTQLCH